MKSFALHGDFIWSETPQTLCLRPDAYAVCDEDGKCAGVFDALPPQYAALDVDDRAGQLILPGYNDLHLHAGQYRNVGLGMDLQLLEWLDTLTFPEEARFADLAFAEAVYDRFAERLRRGFTTHAAIFATVHVPATLLLMEKLEKTGLRTLVGKVNMDRNCPDYLREASAETSLAATEQWLEAVAGRFENTAPILTPRFVPSCSAELMEGLGAIAEAYGVPVQSHLDENHDEIEWVRRLHPEYESYAAVYDGMGLLGPDALMAHCIYMTDAEIELMKERGAWVVHCPTSNINVRSGIAPIRRYMNEGLNIGLGSDISGGHTLDMAAVLRRTIESSKILRHFEGIEPHLSAPEAFYLASRGGGAYFGKVGAFEPGYDFDAVVVDDAVERDGDDDLARRFEKMIYRAKGRNVKAKYVAGRKVY